MPKKLLVTGCGGFVGGGIIHEAGPEWEIHGATLEAESFTRPGLTWHSLNLQEVDKVRALFQEHKFTAVIHTAAMADIDFCQAHQDKALAVNVGVTRTITELCREFGSRLVYMSTDSVFDGEKGMYVEEDIPYPINFYAETKLAAERIVLTLPNAVVERTSLVIGLPVLGAGNSFLSRIIPQFEAGQEVGVPDNEIRTPIDVITLSRALLELAGNKYTGIIHLGGNTRMNRFEMTCQIARQLGFSETLVIVKNADRSPDRAPRPVDASLNNAKARALLETPMVGLEDGFNLVLSVKELK